MYDVSEKRYRRRCVVLHTFRSTLYGLDMADDPQAPEDALHRFPEPEMDEIRAALDGEASKESGVCGERRWSFPPAPNPIGAGVGPEGKIDFGLAFNVVALICKKCGLVGLHHTDTSTVCRAAESLVESRS
jgi:hypothetical protein